jgi:hypothetical protein
VSYVTPSQQLWLKQGMQQGMQQGETKVVIKLLLKRFKFIPDEYLARINNATEDQVLQWAEKILEAKTLEDIFC